MFLGVYILYKAITLKFDYRRAMLSLTTLLFVFETVVSNLSTAAESGTTIFSVTISLKLKSRALISSSETLNLKPETLTRRTEHLSRRYEL